MFIAGDTKELGQDVLKKIRDVLIQANVETAFFSFLVENPDAHSAEDSKIIFGFDYQKDQDSHQCMLLRRAVVGYIQGSIPKEEIDMKGDRDNATDR